MQVTQTSSDGLKRQLKVVVPAGEIGERFNERLDEFKDRVQLKGFRRGKVPMAHIKKLYGRQLMVEVLQSAVEETSRKALTDRDERPAVQPEIKLPESQDEIEKVLTGEADLAFDMAFEVLPKFELVDLASLKLERLVADATDGEIDEALGQIAKRNVTFEADADAAASEGDRVTMNFVGKIDGEAFEGGSSEGVPVVIGQGGFIPGFEDGVKGLKAGDEKVIEATFPEAYPVETLAGKTATFDVKVTEVAKGKVPAIDEEFAKSLGAESVEKLREMVKGQIEREYGQAARTKMKRDMLDALEKAHDFALPSTLVQSEFDGVWKQVTQGLERAGKTFTDEGKTEEEARAEYQKLAERRVRLGLVIGEIGEKNKIQVTQDDLRRALIERARAYPGQEKFVYEYFEKTPGAVDELRAPIFEEKVVDFIAELAKPAERKVSREDLMKAVEAEEAGD
jgi:trigger factor